MIDKTKNLGIHAQKGAVPWNKGLTLDDPRVRKNRDNTRKYFKEHPEKLVRYWKGKKRPEISRLRKGVKHTEEAKKKISQAQRGILRKPIGTHLTPYDHRERLRFRNTMQKLIFERDDYTCQMCEARGVALQVDHIQSWKDYVELRFSMDNCRTLCMDCHYLSRIESGGEQS